MKKENLKTFEPILRHMRILCGTRGYGMFIKPCPFLGSRLAISATLQADQPEELQHQMDEIDRQQHSYGVHIGKCDAQKFIELR